MNILNIQNLTITSQDGFKIIENFNFNVNNNGIIGIYGKGGSGKTTLAYAISGIIPHFLNYEMLGEIFVNGVNIKQIKKNLLGQFVGIVFQNPDYQLFFHKGIMEIKNTPFIEKLIKKYDFDSLLHKKVDWLSYGEKKIVILLSALSFYPSILILDEVFSSLDEKYAKLIHLLLSDFCKENRIVMIMENGREKIPSPMNIIHFKGK